MSSNSREEESSPSADLKFTMEVMMKQFERFDNLVQQNTKCWEPIETRMMELERRQHPRRQERRAPITIFVGDYLKIKREYEIERSCETKRSKENDENKSVTSEKEDEKTYNQSLKKKVSEYCSSLKQILLTELR